MKPASTPLPVLGAAAILLILILAGCSGTTRINCDSKVSELKDGCLYDKAVAELNPDYCGQLAPGLLNPDFDINAAMDDCYKEVAVAKGDPDVCLKVKDAGTQAACLTQYAATTGNPDPCQVLADTEKTQCEKAGALRQAVLKKDFAYCDSLKGEPDIFAECYREVAACLKGNCR